MFTDQRKILSGAPGSVIEPQRRVAAFDSQTDSAVFIQQLNPRSRPLRTGRKAGRTAVGKEATSVPGDLVRQVKRLESPESLHVLPVHDVFEQQGSLWVVMDPVQPLSLHGLLRQQGRLERGYAGYLGVELAEALEELHAAGIAHGHVDPHNVFFRADRSLAVAGYGLVPGPDQDRGPWVRPWQPDSRYTPPELSLGRGSSPPVPTPSGDLWAMGMILHRIVQGTGLLYGPLRRFRAVRKVHDARPPRIRGEHELNLLLEMLLSPHPTVRTSASPAVRSLRRIAGRHEPMAGGHWAEPNRPPRSQWETLRAAVIQLSTNVTSRVVTAFLTGVLVTYFGLHLVDRSPAPDARSALLSSLIFGLASGSVLIVVKIAWYCLALLPRGRLRGRHPTADPQPVAAGSDGAGATSANAPSSGSASPYGTPASTAAPQPSLDAPACTPHLLLRDGPARVGMPTLLEFSLTVPTGHPWTRTAGDDRPPAELMLVAMFQMAAPRTAFDNTFHRLRPGPLGHESPVGGPLVFTHSRYDRATGFWHLLGEKVSGIGHSGMLLSSTPPAGLAPNDVWSTRLLRADTPYPRESLDHTFVNVDASWRYRSTRLNPVGAHSAFYHLESAHLLLSLAEHSRPDPAPATSHQPNP